MPVIVVLARMRYRIWGFEKVSEQCDNVPMCKCADGVLHNRAMAIGALPHEHIDTLHDMGF